jgi:hypothetical protein
VSESSSTSTAFIYNAPGATGVQFDHPCMAQIRVVDAQAGVIQHVAPKRKKIAICGFASSSRHHIPIDDPTWELWAMNQLYRHLPRLDRQFDIHAEWRKGNVEGTDHERWLSEFPGPVYLTEVDPAVPNGVRFPIERMIEKFSDYFTSSVAAMLALAIDEIDAAVEADLAALSPSPDDQVALTLAGIRDVYAGYTIGIFGIDLIVGQEYDFQKACVEYYIGQACARGITIQLPPETALCKQLFRYGWQMEPSVVLKPAEMEARQASLRARKDKAIATYHGVTGAVQAFVEAKTLTPADIDAKIAGLTERSNQAVAEIQTVDGALQESLIVSQVLDLRLKGGVCQMPTQTT